MNKKFSTLLAAALVAGGLSASAAGPSAPGTPVPDGVKDGDNVLLRQVATNGGSFEGPLFIADEDGTLSTRFTPGSLANASFDEVLSAVWKMTVYPAQSQNGYPTYKFVNKKTGQPFAIILQTNNKGISTDQPVLDEAGNQEWSWNTNLGLYKTEGDSTFCFVYAGNKAVLKAVKGEVADAVAAITADGQTAFRLDPTQDDLDSPKDLTPAGFNALVGSTGKLTFANGKDVKNPNVDPENILTEYAWEARSAINADSAALTTTTFYLTQKGKVTKSGNPYMLMTDTLYYNITEDDDLRLNKFVSDTLGIKPTWDADGALTSTSQQGVWSNRGTSAEP